MLKEDFVRDGYGTSQFRLRRSSAEVTAILGRPRKVRSAQGARVYWIYPKAGLEFLVSTRTGRLLSIFFHRRSTRHPQALDLKAADGPIFSITRGDVQTRYGAPYKFGGNFVLSSGEYVRGWMSYKSGIGFHLDRHGKVETVSIFSPVRRNRRSTINRARRKEVKGKNRTPGSS